jgi:hypothetical protein
LTTTPTTSAAISSPLVHPFITGLHPRFLA